MSAGGSSFDPDRVALLLAEIAAEAGRYLAAVPDRSVGVVRKPDGTSASAADRESERLIEARLAVAFPEIPVVAEESCRAHGRAEMFFLVDPLDGTSDYLSGAGEYSVNIALVAGERPLAAALAAPPLDRVWAAGTRALCAPTSGGTGPADWTPVAARPAPGTGLVSLGSRRHGDPESELCLGDFEITDIRTASSAAKFGLLASGEADIYVRCGPTMEWDTAAGDHILTVAGGAVVGPDRRPLAYGRDGRGYLNGPFAAFGDPRLAGTIRLPETAVSRARGRS